MFFLTGGGECVGAGFFSYIYTMVLLEAYPQQMEPNEIFVAVVFFVAVFLIYLLREIPVFKTLWRLVLMFFLILVGTLMWDNIKKIFKE